MSEVFAFGANWAKFLSNLDEDQILLAEQSLKRLLGIESLAGLSFLDVGCGSGLFSLAAKRMGASSVLSFDADLQSVQCAEALRSRYFPNADWKIAQCSILDRAAVAGLCANRLRWDV